MSHDPDAQPSPDDAIPPRLHHDLVRLHRPDGSPTVPTDIDDRIRLIARHRLTQLGPVRVHVPAAREVDTDVRCRRLAAIRWIAISASAAVLALSSMLILPRFGSSRGASGPGGGLASRPLSPDGLALVPQSPLPHDINNDGAVDILDAQRLAFVLRTDGPREQGGASWDINADGNIDQADATAIAQHVVDTKKPGGTG